MENFTRDFVFPGVFVALASACAGGDEDVRVEELGEGVYQFHGTDAADEIAIIEEGTPGEGEEAPVEKASDCVYVQWCNEPGPSGAICRLRTGCTFNEATMNECIRDTLGTCGSPVQPWYLF